MTATIDFTEARRAIRLQHISLRFADVLTEAYRLAWVPAAAGSFATACWAFVKYRGEEFHLLTFGERLAEQCPNSAQLPEYALRYYRHEVAHSLYTERDLKALSIACAAKGIPFSLLNLAEDARIEDRDRKASKQPFDWLSFEKAGSDHTATGLLFQLIQAEGDAGQVDSRLTGRPGARAVFSRVSSYYYPNFLAAATTSDLIPLLLQWISEFGANAPAPGDMSGAMELQANEAALEALMAASESLDGKPQVDNSDQTGRNQIESVGNHQFSVSGEQTPLSQGAVDHLTSILRSAFRGGIVRAATRHPAKRLNLRAIMTGGEKLYRRKTLAAAGRAQRIRYLHDCSGSMEADGVKEAGIHLLAALNRLAASGQIELQLTLTGVYRRRACHESFRFPVAESVLEAIPADGDAEGLNSALRAIEATLEPGDLVLAYTDGQITDRPLDRSYWHRRGVYSIGLYAGAGDQTDSLKQWFDAAVWRKDVAALANELARILHERRAIG